MGVLTLHNEVSSAVGATKARFLSPNQLCCNLSLLVFSYSFLILILISLWNYRDLRGMTLSLKSIFIEDILPIICYNSLP